MEPLGLIAGQGAFPLLVARGARAAGRGVVCVGLRGSAAPELAAEVDRFHWASPVRPNRWLNLLRAGGCSEAILVGRVRKERMYEPFFVLRSLPDRRALRIWYRRLRGDKRPGAVLRALREELADGGIRLIDSTAYCADHLASPGVMTRRQPTARQWEDIRFAWELCVTLSRMDIGQALAVYERDVIAVEALEGTDAMIQRAGSLCRAGGWSLIKVANTHADMRLDVPTIGAATIENLHAAGGACIVLEPGKTMILEKPKVLELADRCKIAVVGYEKPPAA